MNDTKRLGRPRTFNEDEALLAAMDAFWTKGYDGTSLKDLTRAMGISGPSLYAAFGDKRGLYLQTIDRYADVNACEPVVTFESEPDLYKAVRGFLSAVIVHATDQENGARGCYLASCVIANADEVQGVAERLERAISDTDKRLAARFEAEKTSGTLPEDFPSKERAQLMYDIRQGIMFRGRAGWPKRTLMKDIDHRVRMIIEA